GFFLAAAEAGIRQAVILASGLDARAYRLPWPAGTTVFEIDQPQVTEFKTTTLADLGASPTAELRVVSVDLRHDWAAALRAAGLDTGAPIAWSAEGLLPFLPPDAQDRLLDAITELSCAGSRLATENLREPGDGVQAMSERIRDVTEQWREHGFDIEMTDLWYAGERHDVIDYLSSRGWTARGQSIPDLVAEQGLPVPIPPGAEADGATAFQYVTARRG
ncbi:class I SAM-dependent methyltransferase, partial [Mycobacterium sp. 050134]|uniref:class I SAM-dependent methyltransferase n=1 Tax=Mycobacterium sp. 050134 TaxID=3096111 RepID=UPI002EDB9624